MSRFIDKFHHTHHDEKHKDDTASASASSGRTSRYSKQLSAQSSSPPPYTEASKNQPFGLSSEDRAAATRAPGAIDKKFQPDAGVGASYSSSQSASRGTDYPGPSTVHTSLQLCQHEDLTFERLQFIKGILYDKYLKKGIDIIKNTKEEQHEVTVKEGGEYLWACHADDDLKRTIGTIKMKLSSKPHRFFVHSKGPVIGLELHVHWAIETGRAFLGNTRDKIDLYLQKCDKVLLCPHRKLNDPWIQETIYNFRKGRDAKLSSIDKYIQRTHQSKPPPPQPPQAYDCDRCKTHVEVSYKPETVYDEVFVKITRHLGEGVSENDPTWLAQCGIEP